MKQEWTAPVLEEISFQNTESGTTPVANEGMLPSYKTDS